MRHEIIEEHGEFDPDNGIGNTLYIRDRKYHDLDEILVRHVQPIARFLKKMYAFRNYDNKVVSKEGEFQHLDKSWYKSDLESKLI